MEPVLIAMYREMLKAYPVVCSVDRILEDPALRGVFLTLVRAGGVDKSEFGILHTLNNLRKRSKLPRRGDDD